MVAAYRSHTVANSASASYTINRPTGTTAGDVLVLCVLTDTGDHTDIGTPSGWTLAVGANSDQDFTRGRVFVKTAGGSEPTSYTVTHDGTSSVAILFCVQDGQVPGVYASASAGSGNNIQSPSITPSSSSGIEIRFVGFDGDGNNRQVTPPSGYTEPSGADLRNQSYTHGEACYKVLESSAATGALNHLASGSIVSRLGFTIFIPSAATSEDATATPNAVTATATIPAPAVDADAAATVTPEAVAAYASVPAPGVSTGEEPAEIEFVGATHSVTLSGSLPSGVQQGDVLLAIVSDQEVAGGPSGWTKLGSDRAGEFFSANVWAIQVGSSSPSLEWTGAESAPILDIVAYRNTSLPEVYAQSAAGSAVAPSVTTTEPDSVLVCLYSDEDTPEASPPSGMTLRTLESETAFNVAADQLITSPGSTGTRTFSDVGSAIGAWSVVLAPTVSAVHATATPGVVSVSAVAPSPSVDADAAATATPTVVAATVSIPAPDVDDGSVAAPPTVVDVTEASGFSTPLTVDAPDGLQAGDLLLAFHAADIGDLSDMPAPTDGAAWNLLDDYSDGTDTIQVRVWWKIAGSSEPSSWEFDQNDGADGTVIVVAYRDAADDTPTVEVAPGEPFSTSEVDTPGITPPSAASTELRFAAGTPFDENNAWTTPAGLSELADIQSSSYTTAVLAARDLESDSPTGIITFTASALLDHSVGVTVGIAGTASSGGDDATAQPAVVEAGASIPAPQPSAGSTVAAASVQATAGVPVPSVSAGVTASPSTVSAAASIPAPGAAAGSTANPGVAAVQASIPGATTGTGSTASAAAVEATASIPTPEVTAVTTASPEVVVTAAAIPEPGVAAGATASTIVVEATATVPAPTTSAGATASPGVVSATSTIPQATATTAATATPAVVEATAGVPAPDVSAGATATAGLVTATAAVPEPTVATGQIAHPVTVTASVVVPAPALVYGQTVTPSAVAASAAVPVPIVQSGSSSTATPATVDAQVSIPEPPVSAGAVASAAVVAVEATIPTSGVSASSTAQTDVVEAYTSIPAPSAGSGTTATPGTVTATTAIPTPTAEADVNATATPATVHAAATIPTPTAGAGATATPAVVLATAAVPTPTGTVLVTATAQAVEAYATIPAALVSTTARPNVVAAHATVPTPSVSTSDLPPEVDIRVGPPTRWWSASDPARRWQAAAPTR